MYPESNTPNALSEKLQAQGAYENAKAAQPRDMCGAVQSIGQTPSRLGEYRLRDEAQNRANQHQEIADKAQAAAIFLHEHPEFDEFIRLVRKGAIQF